ncbi:MAG TPA: DNA translocase FtsK, partial [Clostridia bacterium]|nr:DNA translocase FtsK [Clostridia bacterium]
PKPHTEDIEVSRPIAARQQPSDIKYEFPPISLLSLPDDTVGGKEDNYKEKAERLISTLNSFGIQSEIINISRGPAITRFELAIAKGVKVSRILALSDDIALSMATAGVRIEAPIPGKSAIGVEVPNKSTAIVTLRELIDTKAFREHPSHTYIGLGKDIAGNSVLADLHRMPHLLIAGTTGSGKSVCINCIIISLLYKATPDDVKLLMIDPKVVELKHYNGIPHLLMPVVTDPKKAAGALNMMVREMETRYKLFAEADVRDISRYNEVMQANNQKTLPRIVIVIDELADLMMVAADEVENSICRLAQLARAAGMYLVIATQRPSVNVITGLIKANLPSRISFAVSSIHDSRTILDMAGAEKLLGRGDMLYYPSGVLKPTRLQGAFLSDTEVRDVVDYVKSHNSPDYDEELVKINEDNLSETATGDEDELFPQALKIVIECEQASISLLQRKMRIGYSRAGRLIDEMASRGYISSSEGSKPRQVLITREKYESLYGGEDFAIGN